MGRHGVHRYCLSKLDEGYKLYNKSTRESFKGNCKEALICQVSKHHEALKVHRRKNVVIFNSNEK